MRSRSNAPCIRLSRLFAPCCLQPSHSDLAMSIALSSRRITRSSAFKITSDNRSSKALQGAPERAAHRTSCFILAASGLCRVKLFLRPGPRALPHSLFPIPNSPLPIPCLFPKHCSTNTRAYKDVQTLRLTLEQVFSIMILENTMSTNATFFRCSAHGKFFRSRIVNLKSNCSSRRCRRSASRMCGCSTRKAHYTWQSILCGSCSTRHSQRNTMPITSHLSHDLFSILYSLFPAIEPRRPKVEDAGALPAGGAGVLPA